MLLQFRLMRRTMSSTHFIEAVSGLHLEESDQIAVRPTFPGDIRLSNTLFVA